METNNDKLAKFVDINNNGDLMYKFLVIEDDETIQLIIKRLLTKNFQCEITSAANGLEALKKLETELPDLILLDISMPIMDGIATLQAIRSDDRLTNLPVIMLTAMNDKTSVSSVVTKGISDYILKPINFSTAPDRIKNVLKHSKLKNSEVNGEKREELPKETILVIDKDKAFRSFVVSLLSEDFFILEAANSVDGLTIYIDKKPQYILITEKQEILNEKILAQKVKNNPEKNFKGIFLLRENLINDHIAQTYFTGVMKRTMVKHEFLRHFQQSLLHKVDTYILIKEILKDNFSEEIISVIQQGVKEKSGNEITAQVEALTQFNDWKQISTASFVEPDSRTYLNIKMYSEKDTQNEIIEGTESLSYSELYSFMSSLIIEKFVQVFDDAQIQLNKTESELTSENVDIESRHQLNIEFSIEAKNYIGLSVICEKAM